MATGAAWLDGNRLKERRKKKEERREKREEVCLDISRPSHGRT
jgi:hypothetical protein